jgi:hypothetical protein
MATRRPLYEVRYGRVHPLDGSKPRSSARSAHDNRRERDDVASARAVGARAVLPARPPPSARRLEALPFRAARSPAPLVSSPQVAFATYSALFQVADPRACDPRDAAADRA